MYTNVTVNREGVPPGPPKTEPRRPFRLPAPWGASHAVAEKFGGRGIASRRNSPGFSSFNAVGSQGEREERRQTQHTTHGVRSGEVATPVTFFSTYRFELQNTLNVSACNHGSSRQRSAGTAASLRGVLMKFASSVRLACVKCGLGNAIQPRQGRQRKLTRRLRINLTPTHLIVPFFPACMCCSREHS